MGIKEIVRSVGITKNLPRTGWLTRGIPPSVAESIAEHMFESAIYSVYISYELNKNDVAVDLERVMLLTLTHDLPEAYIGDILRGVKKVLDTDELETNVADELGVAPFREAIIEYIEGETLEAKVSKLSELLATYIQAKRYYDLGYTDIDEILESTYEGIARLFNEKPISKIRDIIESLISGEL